MTKITPMMQQYLDIKSNYQDCLLLYRMGDFYELFYDDAIKAAPILNIVLTKRGQDDSQIPMCGIPHHSSIQYIQKLIESGEKVAVCEQLETPEEAKKRSGHKAVVRRDVVRVITPGTLLDDTMMTSKQYNFIASVSKVNDEISLAYTDISTGDFFVINSSNESLLDDLIKLDAKEVLFANKNTKDTFITPVLNYLKNKATVIADSLFDFFKNFNKVKNYFDIFDDKVLQDFSRADISSIGSLLEYINNTQKSNSPILKFPKKLKLELYMKIDSNTLSSLDIISNDKNIKSTVFNFFCQTVTAGGSRLLRSIFVNPIIDKLQLEKRLDSVEYFLNEKQIRDKIAENLKQYPDFERILARITTNKTGPNEVLQFAKGLLMFMDLHAGIITLKLPSTLLQIAHNIETKIFATANNITKAIIDNPPTFSKEGGFIKEGYDAVCDKYINLVNNAEKILSGYLLKYKEISGVQNLKIGYNENIGYFIEASPQAAIKLESHDIFKRRQTLVSCSRYVSDELLELEKEILHARERLIAKENEIFSGLCNEIVNLSSQVFQIANFISNLDVCINFAVIAEKYGYSRPLINTNNEFIIQEGFHPVIAAEFLNYPNKIFQNNDTNLSDSSYIALLTGPNMAGKSTYLKQNAIIAFLGQIGSFVPAKYASLPIFDAIYSRIGAGDDIASGQSTFMVEMSETAKILLNATSKSLIIIDELGRGTATFDGMAIASATLEYIHNNIRAKCFFATHYHELANLDVLLQGLHNLTVLIEEHAGNVEFLHKIVQGRADKSYGIYVAKIAGIPQTIIQRAKVYLNNYESNSQTFSNSETNYNDYDSVNNKVKAIDLDNISPKEALEILYELKELSLINN